MMRNNLLKSFGFVLLGAVAASGAWHVLEAANAANTDTYRQLNLFGDVFDRVRSDYVEVPDEEKLIEFGDQRHADRRSIRIRAT